MDKRALVLLAFLLLPAACSAQFYLLDSHTIEVNVDPVGNAQVTERYFLTFQNEQQLADFRQTVKEIGASLEGWRSYDSRIYPRIGQENDIVVSGISFIENANSPNFLEINYALKTPIMEKKSETSRVIDYSLRTKFFNDFVQGSLWVIPQGTSITLNIPKGAEIEGLVRPDATVEGNTITWNGYVFGNELALNYRLFKQIASFDLNLAISELINSEWFWMAAPIAALIALLVLAKRKSISSRIESYIVEHSDLSYEEED